MLRFVLLSFASLTLMAFVPLPAPIKAWLLVGVVLAVSWFCLKLEGEPLVSIGLGFNVGFLSIFLLGTLFGVMLILASAVCVKCFAGFSLERNPGIGLGGLFHALIPMLAVSMYEELIFRGYAFQRAVRGLGKTPALMLFALLFAGAHWANPGMSGSTKAWASLNIGLASVFLGLAWICTKSLALPIGIHFGWNWAQGSLLGFGVSGATSQGYWKPVLHDAPQWLTGGDFGLEAALPTSVVCLLACGGLWLFSKPSAPK